MFDKSLVTVGIRPTTSNEAIREVGKLLFKNGYVKKSFVDAVICREEEFATGLPLGEINVAVPHTDPEHVRKAGIAVGVLTEPVEFTVMGSVDEVIPAQVVFMLALKDAEEQVEVLQKLCTVLQRKEVVHSLVQTQNSDQVMEILETHFSKSQVD